MAICFHGEGEIILKKETAKEFAEKFKQLSEKYDKETVFTCSEEGCLNFKNYARHFFMGECQNLIEENISSIIFGRLLFTCYDEDGSVNKPFPFFIMNEIVDGNLYSEALHTRLPYELNYTTIDGMPYCALSESNIDGTHENDVITSENTTTDNKDLPF